MVASDVTLVTVIEAAVVAPTEVGGALVVVWIGEVFGFVAGA